jgi:hypothetical protein
MAGDSWGAFTVKFSAFATLAALAVAQPASAAIIQVSLTGTVSEGFDQSGLFGAPNTDLTGAIFSLVEYFDTTKGTLVLGGPTEILAGGIHFNGDPSSPGSAILTLNGVATPVGGNVYSFLDAMQNGGDASVIDRFFGDHVTTENILEVALDSSAPLHLLDGWHSDCPVADRCRGEFYFSQYAFVTNPGTPASYLYRDRGTFDVDTFDVQVLSVPEPATWAMMIAGFGLVGGTLRRRAAVAG